MRGIANKLSWDHRRKITFRRAKLLLRTVTLVPILAWHADTALGDDVTDKIESSARFGRATDIYRDCVAVRPNEHGKIDLARVQESWDRSYQSVRSYFLRNGGERINGALGIESILTNARYSTKATVEDVIAILNKGSIQVKDSPDPSYTFTSSPHKIIVTTGLIRHVCDYLLPKDTFDTLIANAVEAARHPNGGEGERQQALSAEEANKLAATIVIRGIQYAGLKIFVLGHETSHLAFDQFSSDLVEAKGIQELCKGFQAIFYLEIRADMIGLSTVKSVPVREKIDQAVINNGFSDEEIEAMGKIAVFKSFDDLLTVIEKEASWQAASDCVLSQTQRRDTLDLALRSLNK